MDNRLPGSAGQGVVPNTPTALTPMQPELQQHRRPIDGKLVPVVTQGFEDPHLRQKTERWLRYGKPLSTLPSFIYVVYWVWSPTLKEGGRDRVFTATSISATLLRLLISWPLMAVLMCNAEVFFNTTPIPKGETEFDRRYEPVRCDKDLISTTNGSNETGSSTPRTQTPGVQFNMIPLSVQSPIASPSPVTPAPRTEENMIGAINSCKPTFSPSRYLCFVKDFDQYLHETMKASEYIDRHGDNVDLEFVFVSYTRMHFIVASDEEIDSYDYPSEEMREATRQVAHQDRQTLICWGIDAARQAKKKAFWLDFECIRDSTGVVGSSNDNDGVYTICDIVRAAHSMIIAIGPLESEKTSAILKGEQAPEYRPENVTPWLRQWGSRLWTLPELLLCPREYRVKLYVLGDSSEPIAMAKRNFAERAWDDAEAVTELVNHFEGCAILQDLQLMEAALACFSTRNTDKFSQGDIAYAMMGLVSHRRRPRVDKADSGFEAFAKLALSNGTGLFLVQLISLLPTAPNSPWYDTRDHWGAKISEIYPIGRVAAIEKPDTIVIDGAHGASIQWDALNSALFSFVKTGPHSFMAWLTMWYLTSVTNLASIFAISLFEGPSSMDWQSIVNFISVMLTLVLTFSLPVPLYFFRFRKPSQNPFTARLIGVEGHVDPAKIEKHFVGFNHGDFTLVSANDSPIMKDEYPFSLVDTSMMTVTWFNAKSPPVAMLIVGGEGSMQRALLCSYDWRKRTYSREAMLRIGREIIKHMHPVDGVRFSLNTSLKDGKDINIPVSPASIASSVDVETGGLACIDKTTFAQACEGRPRVQSVLFLCLALLAARVDILSFHSGKESWKQYERDWKYDGLHWVYDFSFLIVQFPAYYMLRYIPVQRIFPIVATLKGFELAFTHIHSFSDSSQLATPLFCLRGILDSMIIAIVVIYTWSWYSSQTLPLCFLLLSVIGILFRYLQLHFEDEGDDDDVTHFMPVFSCALCFILAVFGSFTAGPRNVSGPPAHQKLASIQQAAINQFFTITGTMWQRRRVSNTLRISE
ncbi:hypothetical protein EDB80DRAFT_776375 [Ilyonectria destructans]|nr:hypothetical protein EDB80DRAFT_836487 [Ilyonectria destructans]KAH7010103.1 hypothetical protein EDB80DRAFT_776375 [Ilyonectria destructans]